MILDFLRERLAEDEACAKEALHACEVAPSDELSPVWESEVVWGTNVYGEKYMLAAVRGAPIQATRPTAFAGVADHIARYDPARALWAVAAKRRIIEAHDFGHECPMSRDYYSDPSVDWHEEGYGGPCYTLMALAMEYADHEDFDDRWIVTS